MKLTRDLAKKIVKNTMDVLGKNINIMDYNGIIIASGNQERINMYHKGAAEVVKTGKRVIIKDKDIAGFKGVKPGINLPIRFNERIIGVVGITGDANEVAGYGEIVKNMVELILQQEFLRREIEAENKACENFFQQLLSNSIKSKELLVDRAKLFDLTLDLARVVIVIEIHPIDNKLLTEQIRILDIFLRLNKKEDIIFSRGDNLILVKSFSKDNNIENYYEYTKKIINKILDRFNEIFDSVIIGVGQRVSELEKLYISYQGAKHALKVGKKVYNNHENNIFFLDHLGYDYFLPYIDKEEGLYFLHHLLGNNIIEVFENVDLGELIEALVENDLNISKAADSIYIHRNTLIYKLNKINEITGLNPRSAKDLFTLLIAYHLYLYLYQ
ncbi:MAG: hypothetical protein FH762_08710 [Firmicutes bacterium]|nr:hypothetical protein [Bacillota bacterium]